MLGGGGMQDGKEAAKLNVQIHAINGDHDATFTADDYREFLALQGIKMIYNRLHGALKLEWAETPTEAFQRKLRPECLLGMMFR